MPSFIPIPLPTRGIVKTVDDERVPPDGARDCENWIQRDRQFQVRPGLTSMGADVNQRPSGFINYDDANGNLRHVMGTDSGWWSYDGQTDTWTDISGTALTATTQQQVFRLFQKAGTTWLLGVNGKDSPKVWDSDTANNYVAMGGSPPIARCIMVLADRVLLGNLSSGGTISPVAIDVSARLDFDSGWSTVLVALLSNAQDIIAMEEMGEFIGAIYCNDSIWLAIAQGGANPFRFEPKKQFQEGDGPASTLSVVKVSDGSHIYLSRDGDVKRFDGSSLASVYPEAGAYLRATANVDTPASKRAWASYDSANEEILFVYAEKGNLEPNLGIVIKERSGATFPFRWLGKSMTAGGFGRIARGVRIGDLTMPIGSISQTIGELASTGLARRTILGESGGQVYESVGEDDAGSGIPFFVETGLYDFGDPVGFKTVTRMQHRFAKIASSQIVTFKIGKSKNGEDRTLSSGSNIDIGAVGPYNTGHRNTAKFMSVRLEGTATKSIVWRGSFVDYWKRGRK